MCIRDSSSIVGDVPNRLIATEAALNRYDGENERNKLPIANYSVIETYNIKLKNSTESTKTIEFILDSESVSYTHLDVYKRQLHMFLLTMMFLIILMKHRKLKLIQIIQEILKGLMI